MKNRQGLTIAALIVAIVGLSIGFAAFSNTLTISSTASVNPSDTNFKVEFASQSSGDSGNSDVTITPTQATSEYGTNATIPYSDKQSLTGVHATFTAPGQSVTYELYVRNAGQYVAYLKDLEFANATNATQGETYKHCYAKTTNVPAAEQATGSLVSAACEGIDISVSIGTALNITPASQSKSLGNQSLAANGGNVAASVTITYANNAAYVDGPMEVEFGDISFIASSNPAVQQQQQEQSSPSTPSESQQGVNNLIPTNAEKNAASPGNDGYNFIDDGDYELNYKEYGTMGYVTIRGLDTNQEAVYYYWFCNSDMASAYNQQYQTSFVANTWYTGDMDEGNLTLYTGESPLSLSDFTIVNENILSYVTRVINSFSNNS